ncbi:MAG: preprotein translocase subunit Sec61beta [Candidatus Aenigmatarchaeota archaeon]
MRYFETTKETIKLKPEYVIIACVGIAAIEIALRFLV